MIFVRRLARRLRHLFRRQQSESDMAEEMRFHLEQRAADYAADGLPDDEAGYAARRKFGNIGSLQEQAREERGWLWLENLVKDLRLGLSQLIKAPGFSLLAIVTLGLGIGANTSMFSILNHLLLKPLPYADPEQLDRFYRATAQKRNGYFSAADFLDFQRAKEGYGDVAAYTADHESLSAPGEPAELAYVGRSTANLFPVLGIAPQFGRGFRSDEDTPGRDRVVILSQRVWLKRFGGKPDIIGDVIRLDGEPHEIIGVMPASFNDWRHLGVIDIFRPLAFTSDQAADRHLLNLRLVGRRSGVRSSEEAAAFVASFGARLATDFPDANAETAWRAVPLRISTAGSSSLSIVPMLIGLSSFVLLIACSNLANLLLARTMARAREFAVRAALGASRTQLLRPLIAESLLFTLAGAALGVFVALWFSDWAAVQSTGENGEQVHFELDWRVASWTFGASLLTALAFGIAPALYALRLDLNHTLKSGGRGTSSSRGHRQFSRILIIGQFALAMVLLAGAGLFVRGLYELNNRRSGWESDHLLTASIVLPSGKYSDADKIGAFHRLALERIASLPGVASASVSTFTPFFNWPDGRKFVIEGRERPQLGREPAALVNTVSAQYFDTFGTPLIAGRSFDQSDTVTSGKVYVLSQATARVLFGNENPVGRRLAQVSGDSLAWGEVIGVVGDVQGVVAETDPVFLQIYQAMTQEPSRSNEVAVRTTGVAPAVLIDRIRTTMAELDADLPVRRLQSADATIRQENYQLGVLRDVLTGIAVLGLGLAALGIYGIISRTMAQRTAEFAIRLALGACIRDLTRLVLTSGVKLALVGSTLGLIGALGVSQVLASAFPGIRTDGAVVMTATTLLLVAVALLACWLPARRAGKVDAMAVLRAE